MFGWLQATHKWQFFQLSSEPAGRLTILEYFAKFEDIGRYFVPQTAKHSFERRIGLQTQRKTEMQSPLEWVPNAYILSCRCICRRNQWLLYLSRFVSKIAEYKKTENHHSLDGKAHCDSVSQWRWEIKLERLAINMCSAAKSDWGKQCWVSSPCKLPVVLVVVSTKRVLVDARQQSMYLSGAEYLPLVQTSSGAEHQWCKVCRVQVLVAHSALGTGRVVAWMGL